MTEGKDPMGDRGRPPSPPPPPTKNKAYPDGSYMYERYDAIQPYTSERDFDGMTVWHINERESDQVEAVIVKTSQNVQLTHIGVGKEARANVPVKYIEYVEILRGR
jgi:hypothetical protein